MDFHLKLRIGPGGLAGLPFDWLHPGRTVVAVGGAVALGGAAALLAAGDRALLAMAALGLVAGIVVIARWPETAALIAIVALYGNLSVIAMRYQGVPSWLATSVLLLLAVPLVRELVIRRQKLLFGPAFVLLLLYLAVQALATFGAVNPDKATVAVARFLGEGVIVYFVIVNVVRSQPTLRRVIWTLLLTGGVLGALAAYMELTHTYNNTFGGLMLAKGTYDWEGNRMPDWRPGGPVGDANYFAQMLLILVPLGAMRVAAERRLILRGLAGLLTLLVVAGVVATASRGAAIALVLMLLLVALRLRIRLYQLAVIGLVVAAAVPTFAPSYWERIQTVAQGADLFGGDGTVEDPSIRARFTLMTAAWYVFLDHPALGVGPDNFPEYYYEYARVVGMKTHKRALPPHDLYVGIAAESGAAGFAVFGALLTVVALELWRVRRRRGRSTDLSYLADACLIAWLGYLVAGIFLHLAFVRYFTLLLALSAAVVQIAGRAGGAPPPAGADRRSLPPIQGETHG